MKFFILPLSKGKLYFNGTSLIKSIILFILFSSTINSTVIAQSPCTSPLGAVPSLTCPKVAQFQILQGSSCDIDQAVPGIKFGCATTLGNLRRTNGNTTCECNDNAACVGEWDTSESSNWSGNRQVYFDINFDPTKTVSFGQLLIQAITGPNIGGTGQNNNYPRKLAIKVYQNGNEIYTTNNITMSTTTWSYSTIDLTSLQNLPGNATYRIGIVAYDLNSGTGMAAQEFKDIQLSACCSDACDPDNPNAPPFCAPTPTCAAGSFLWTQAINQTDGSSSLRMFCGSTTSYTIPGPYPAAYNSGVSINVSDVVSYDGYASRNTVTQANERWRIVFKKNGIVQASTGYTNDVPDLRNQGYWRGSLGTVILPSGTDQIVIEHWSVANDGSCGNGPNSVAPTSICLQHTVLNSTSCNPVLPNLCAANILKAYNIIDPGTFCNPSAWTDDRHIFSNNNGAFQVKPGTTPLLIEYTDGTVRGLIEVVKSNGTFGNVDLTRGYLIEVIGSQKTTGSPVAPWSPAVGCTPNTGNWTFYNTFTMNICGTGAYAGQNYNIVNPPQANNHPFQIGTGASMWNNSLGGGIWFNPTQTQGDLQFRLNQITLTVLSANAPDVQRCFGQSAPLTATASGGSTPYTYVWSDGLANGANRSVAGTYTVTVTDGNGCTATDQAIFIINPQLTLPINNDEVCAGPNFIKTVGALYGTPGYTYNWSNNLGTGNQKSLPTQNAIYTVTATDSKGCTAVTSFTVTVITTTANITGTQTICAGGSSTFTASGGGTYVWSSGATTASINVSIAGTYSVTVTNNGCTAIGTRTLSVTSNPTATITGTQTICAGGSSTFTASGGGTYSWSTGANTASINVSTAGTYTVTVTNNGCTAVGTRTLTVSSKPTANITATGNNCLTANAQLFGSATGGAPGYSYAYTGPNGFSSTQQNPMITQNGTYTLVVTDQNGCTDDVNIIIFNEFLPTAISASSALCAGESTILTASGGGTYAWSSNTGSGTTNQVTVTPATTTTYTVTVTSVNGCVATATVQVNVYTKPVVTNVATVANTSCNNTSNTGSITVTATGQTGLTKQYRINGGTWQLSNIFNNLGNGTYNVEVSYVERACYSNPASATISSQSGLTVNAENNKTVCPSTNFTLSATAAGGTTPYTYGWTGGLVGTPVNVSGIMAAQTYIVTVTDNKGCTATDNVVVSVHALPAASIAKDGDLTCTKTTTVLTASPSTGVTYLWSVSNQTSRSINVTSAATYTVTVTSTTTGCASSASIVVTQNITKPNANAGADKTLTCTTTSATLNGSSTTSSVTYGWIASNGGNIVSGGNTATPTINNAGTYTLTVTNNSNGCTATDFAQVTLNNTPPANVSADNIGGPLTCIDNSVTIRAFPDVVTYTYAWSGPSGYTATSRSNNVSVAGNYTVTVTDSQNGCTASSSTAVLQNVDIPTANAGGDRTICNGTSTTLTATGNGSYLWSNNMTTASITVTPVTTTTYTITVTGSNGCTNTASALVTVTPLPASGLTGPTEVCMDEYGVFSASPVVSGATYSWTFDGGTSFDGDANDPTESVKWAPSYANTTRTVTLVVTKDNCSSTYTKAVLVKQGAYLNTQALYPVCQGGTVQIGPNPNDPAQVTPGSSFQWTPNLFLNNNTVARPLSTPPFDIEYTLTATVNGCATSMQITVDVNVNLNPIADAGADKVICLSESTTIGGTPTATPPPTGGATISGVLWSVPPSSTITSTLNNPLVSPTLNTQYRVVVVASNGCTDTDFVNITVNPKQKIGNYTWIDSNKDGCQTTGELGLNGVTVSLYTTTGTLVTTATTSNNPTNGLAGYYQFEVCPGNYYVNFGQPTGYIFTGKNICGDVPSNSDANTTNGNVDPFTIVSGQDNFTIDAGFIAVGNIRGNVTADTNNDNVGDTPLANVTINLKDLAGNIVATDVTDASGNYEFLNIPTGEYTIMQVQPTGYNSVSDVDATPDPDGNDGSTPNNMIPVTLTTGENDNDNNLVEEQTANIRGNVTADTNNDNIGDSPLANVTINLKDLAGNIVATDVTDASGNYEFLGVAPGQYTIMEVQPTGYNSVSDVDATPDPDGNDGTTPNDMIPVTVTAGENDNDNNLVEEQTGSIRGTVTKDTNNDNVGDSPLANVTINLKDLAGNIVATDVTDASGNYEFLNVAPGQYTIMEVQPTGYNSVSDVDATPDPDGNDGATPNDMIPVTVTAGEADNDNNLVEEQTANIRGNVTADTNNDNIGDTPLANVTINLKDLAGNIVATDVTDASGNYEFLNVAPGQYTIMEVQPTGYNSVSDVDATPDPDGNDGATPNDMIPVTVTAGENDIDNNFVEENLASLGNYVWEDKDADGIQEAGEPGIANVVVRLFNSAGTQVAFKVTDNSGYYLFANLVPGTYTVKFDKPAGYESTSKDLGADNTIDSDADMVTGITVPVVLNGGEDNLTVDAGFYKLAKIGNFVWEDKNANGVQDAFEPGIANVTVTLTGTDALGRVVNLTTTTNESGVYEFTGLVPGTYTVTFTKPGLTYKPSPSDTPADDAKDSDANAISGKSGSIVLVSGTDNQTIDAGYYRCGYVGDYVWLDNNLNNLQDVGDVGINGVLVELYKSSNPSTPVQTMLTINDPSNPSQAGYYNFEVCELGNYFIKVKADMTIYNWVQPNQGLNDGIDSDIIDFESQTTLIFTVGYAAAIEDIDAGLKLIPLPVSLSTFTGRWNESRDVNELNWVTMSEVNNDYFELERSFKGSAFEKVGIVSGQGNSNKEVRYAIDDADISRNGIYTYRLRQVDFDGRESYSSIVEIKVDRKAENGSKIYPNPSVGQVNISVTANEGQKVEANVYDNTGRIVLGSLINTVSEGKDIDSIIERGILAKGIYYVMISIDGEVTSHKLIILE